MVAADFTHLYQQAIAERTAQYGGKHPKVAAAWLDLALYRKEQGDATGAEAALRSMIAISTAPLAKAEGLLELAALTSRYADVPAAAAVLEKAAAIPTARAVALNGRWMTSVTTVRRALPTRPVEVTT